MLKKLNILFVSHGLDIKKLFNSLRGTVPYFKNLSKFRKQLADVNSPFTIKSLYPCLDDRYDSAGSLPLHYFHLDRYVASRIFVNNPHLHVDIGSRIDGFIAHLSVFRDVEVLDIREMNSEIPNVRYKQADLTSSDFPLADYCDSVSSLHAIEHFGLGRYGDPLDAEGHLKAIRNFHRMLKPGGRLYFAVPIGPLRIEYDAHRVFSVRYLLDIFSGMFELEKFSYISDDNRIFTDVELTQDKIANNLGCTYGCGIFELRKIRDGV